MKDTRLGNIEARFAAIIWDNAPISTSELVLLAHGELGWQRTTTYTVLKRLSERGLFINDGGTVRVLVSREEFYSRESERVVDTGFGGSLPAFVAAFTSKKTLDENEIAELEALIRKMRGEG